MLPTNSAQLKLFDKKFVALTLRDARHCEKCKREYDIKYKYSVTDNKPHSSRPVLLSCGHNICENCIYLHRNNLKCAVCSIQIEFEHTRWLKKSYDLNFCLLGQLMNSKSFLSSEAAPAGAIYSQTSGMLAQESFIQKCSECEQAPAIGICMHCKVDFCKRCFTAVHQNSKVLKKHRMSEFEMQTLQLHLPKERMCKMHKRLCDKFCSDCQSTFCPQCIRAMHGTHRVAPLNIENANHKDKIISFLETMKQTRDHIRKAQKDTRVCENRLEDFATGSILEVSDYFLELHNFLQLEERRIIDEFKKSARSSQNAINDACAKLSDCQTTLNNMRSTLEGYLQKPPHEFHINAVIELATMQLERIPCQIQISTIEKNPFVFKKLKDIRMDISKSYEVAAQDPEISFRITPMYGDLASFEISSERAVSPEPMSLTRLDTMDHRESTMSISLTSTIAIGRNKRVGRVTNIISPSQFYVQSEEGISEVRQLLVDIDGDTGFVESINPGDMYLVYHDTDKAWFRGIVKEELKRPKQFKNKECIKYKVFLLDYGIFEEIQKKCLRKILDNVRAIPAASVSCGLLDLAPVGKEWPSEARELMEEIIQNKPVQVIIQDTTKSPWNVELFTLKTGEPISIREALIYTGMAVDSSASMSQRNIKFTGAKPTQVSKMKQRLQRPMLHSEEFFRVKITHIENPQQFFAIKFSQLEELANLEAEMDLEYSNKQSDTIYYAQLHMCCALLVEGKWHRGCVEEINDPNDIRVRLVDDGRSITVNWRQLHVLKERFISECELSIECSLADVQALQKNAYEWTETAIAEFKRMTSNPNIHMTITSRSQFRYQVILNVVKKHLDINIAAMLVKFNHALTTGEASAGVENIRDKKFPIDPLLIADEKIKPADSIFRTLKRTSVQVIHIITPGEFYIHLVEHIPGILKFHEELQLAQEKRQQEDSIDSVEWQVNDHCIVFTSVTETASKQWFRGVVLEKVALERYVVFLRDKGLTIRDLRKDQLTPIADLFDRICNAATLCHLACVHPTGGMQTWSHSSIDEFVHHVSGFESLGATIQGATVNCSIPVVLWGMMTETNDPLAPCTTKYTNINKILVSAGLAHLSEKIDLTRQLDQFVQAEMEHGQQTLQDWYENFKKTIDELPECLDDIEESEAEKSIASGLQISEPTDEYGTATEWLPAQPIEKTVFTAYPTYVDDEAIVYLHDADKHTLLNKMKTKINKDIELKPLMKDEKWVVGQPCLARYHLDSSLYRACIHRKVTDLKYEVRFIDYGNIEACDVRDLHKMMAFPHIPTQAVRFRIDGIRPKGEQASFSVTVLDLIHGVIVDKLCGVRVPNGQQGNEIKRCSIRFDRNDLATYLIQNGFVAGVGISKPITTTATKKSTQLAPWPLKVEPEIEEKTSNSDDELREFMKHQICDPTEEIALCTPPPEPQDTVAMFKPDEYRRMFEKMQNEKFYKSVKDIDSEHSSPLDGAGESDEDDDIVELEFSFRSNYWNVDNNAESGAPPMLRSDAGSNFEKFDPLDSSSLLSNFSGIEAFKQPQLPTSVTSFYCDVGYVRSPTILHIFPHLSELEYRQVELARRIQIMVPRMAPLVSFDLKVPCIARYSKDKLWYRAIIRSHNAIAHQVKVFYVDFLNTELVAEEFVRNCPMELLSWPLRTFEMKLFGLKTNPRMREKDVKQAVSKCLKGRTLYAKIIRARGKMTEVCLFNSKAEKEIPVYEDLIIQKYFCKE